MTRAAALRKLKESLLAVVDAIEALDEEPRPKKLRAVPTPPREITDTDRAAARKSLRKYGAGV